MGIYYDTLKRREIMTLVLEAADRGEVITQADLFLRLSYANTCTLQAIRCSVKFLTTKWGMISKTRITPNLVYLYPTKRAYEFYRKNHEDIQSSEEFPQPRV